MRSQCTWRRELLEQGFELQEKVAMSKGHAKWWTWRRDWVRFRRAPWTPKTRLIKEPSHKTIKDTEIDQEQRTNRDQKYFYRTYFRDTKDTSIKSISAKCLREHREHTKYVDPEKNNHNHSVNQVQVPLNTRLFGRRLVAHVWSASEIHSEQFHSC